MHVVRGLRTKHGAAKCWWHRRGRGLGNKVTCPITRSRTAKVKASWPRDILTAAVERTNRSDDLEGAIMEFSSPASAHDAGKRWEGPDFQHSSQEAASKGPKPQAAATMMKNHFVYRPVELIKWNTFYLRGNGICLNDRISIHLAVLLNGLVFARVSLSWISETVQISQLKSTKMPSGPFSHAPAKNIPIAIIPIDISAILPYCCYYLRVLHLASFAKLSTRKNVYQHVRQSGVYNHKLRDVFQLGACINVFFWSFLRSLFFLPVPSRAQECDSWWFRWSLEFHAWNLNFVLTG